MGARVRLCTSAGPAIGRGHLTRALSLAEGSWPGSAEVEIELTEGAASPSDRARANAAGVRLVEAGSMPSETTVCVVDAPDATSIASSCDPDRLVVFDDNEVFEGRAAAIVQPSLPSWHGRARSDRVLAGYEWAPIGASWRGISGDDGAGHDARPQVLVCFGGSDPSGVTARLAPAIASDPAWTTSVVVGHDYRGPQPAGIDIVHDPDDLPARVIAASLVVLGAGTMKFEVAALGRPGLLVAVADDQLEIGPAFAATGSARWLGDGRTLDPTVVHDAITELLADRPARESMSAAARGTIDGAGADRLAAEIVKLA